MIASPWPGVWISISILYKSCFALLNDNVSVAPVAEAYDYERIDLGEHFLGDVPGLRFHDAETDTEFSPFQGTFPGGDRQSVIRCV